MGKRNDRQHRKQESDSDSDEERDDDVAEPFVQIMYEFCTEPKSSTASMVWTWLTSLLELAYLGSTCIQTLNGPNHYTGRLNMSLYPFLFSEEKYKMLDQMLIVPLLLDATIKVILLFCLKCIPSSKILNDIFSSEQMFERSCIYMEIIGMIPLVAVFIGIDISHWIPIAKAAFRITEFLNMSRILRLTRDVPAIWAVRIALYRAGGNLVLPIFFFALFNVSAGVILFFVEPCFDASTCPWHDLFEATYFTVVSMTTVGYGDQKPSYDLGKFFTLCVCFFGALFVSMPLAIIGNEYEAAWAIVSEKMLQQAKSTLDESKKKAELINAYKAKIAKQQMLIQEERLKASSFAKKSLIQNKEKRRTATAELAHNHAAAEDEHHHQHQCQHQHRTSLAIRTSPLIVSFEGAHKSCQYLQIQCADIHESITSIHPGILLGLTQTREYLFVLIQQIELCLDRTQSNMKSSAYNIMCQKAHTLAQDMVYASASATATAANPSPDRETMSKMLDSQNTSARKKVMKRAGDKKDSTNTNKRIGVKETSGLLLSKRVSILDSDMCELKSIDALFQLSDAATSGQSWDPSQVKRSWWVSTNRHDDSIYVTNREFLKDSELRRLEEHSKTLADKKAAKLFKAKNRKKNAKSMEETLLDREHPIFTAVPIITSLMRYCKDMLVYYGFLSSAIVPLTAHQQKRQQQRNKSHNSNQKSERDEEEKSRDDHKNNNNNTYDNDNNNDDDNDNNDDDDDNNDEEEEDEDDLKKKKVIKNEEKVLAYSEQILVERLKDVEMNPDFLSNRIWLVLEVPTSSKEALFLQKLIIVSIIFSVFVLYTETLTTYNNYGESTSYCEGILELYCVDKTPILDPGCYVQNEQGTASQDPLRYHCKEENCFGYGHNFGSGIGNTNMTCDDSSMLQAFSTSDDLRFRYPKITAFTSNAQTQLRSNICNRLECSLDGAALFDAKSYWIYSELCINLFFSLELLMRIAASGSIGLYFSDTMNLIDLFVLIPYYVDVFRAYSYGISFLEIDFSILPSSSEPNILVVMRSLKVLRLFKLTRHFHASRVIYETFLKAWKQILGIITLLGFIVFLFASMLYEIESGTPCYVGDNGCILKDSDLILYQIGDRVVIDKFGDISQIPNVFVGLWYSFITITTVGYGDICPITYAGKVMAILLMLSGTMYMSIPLTVVGNIYYDTHSKYLSAGELSEQTQRREIADRIAAATAAIEESNAGQHVHEAGIAQGISLASMDAVNESMIFHLEFAEALKIKYIQQKLIVLRKEFHKITTELLEPVKNAITNEVTRNANVANDCGNDNDCEEQKQRQGHAKESMIMRARRLSKDVLTVLLESKTLLENLADINYRRESQLSSMVSS